MFATGKVSDQDCVPMPRSPVPDIGAPFSPKLNIILAEALKVNPSIHDGAIVFSRETQMQKYVLAAWSMRIVARLLPTTVEPNQGSAHNSAHSLSASQNIDLCCVISRENISFFEDGQRV